MPSSRPSDPRPPRLLLLDNHDSFTWNLVQAFGALGAHVEVHESDAVPLAGIAERCPDGIVISPGPGGPRDAGISERIVQGLGSRLPILGVCLGHQVIGAAFGVPTIRAARPVHGRVSSIHHCGKGVLRGLPDGFAGMRYHSLVLDRARLSETLECTAWTVEGEVMAVRHRHLPIEGVQFHPESILTPWGTRLLENFLDDVTACGRSPLRCTA